MVAKNTTSYDSRISAATDGPVPDNSALYGIFGAMYNASALIDSCIEAILLGSAVTYTMTGAQFVERFWDVSGAPGGGVAMTTPTAAQIIAALPNTIPKDGQFNIMVDCINDDTGQTITVTAGANVTILGTATVETNTNRSFVVNVNVGAGTVTMMNLGTKNL